MWPHRDTADGSREGAVCGLRLTNRAGALSTELNRIAGWDTGAFLSVNIHIFQTVTG